MAFVETNHTEVVLRKLRSDIDGFMRLVRIVTMVGFSAWYVYLIVTNLASLPHLIAYIALFATFVTTHVVEKTIKPTNADTRKDKRKKVEKRRNLSKCTKAVKYIAKAFTVALALFASITNPKSKWDLPLDIASAVMWVVSLLCEFVTGFVYKYIDYFTISVAMDFEQSGVVNWVKGASKFFGSKQAELDEINNELMADSGESLYTSQEQQIRDTLTEEANTLRTQKAERKKQRQAKIEEQLVEAKAKKKQAHADKVAATKAERQQKLEEKRRAKKDRANARREEKKRKREQKRQANKPKTEQ